MYTKSWYTVITALHHRRLRSIVQACTFQKQNETKKKKVSKR